ncbi:hypothetical protein BAAL111456_29375 [Bacillus albus]
MELKWMIRILATVAFFVGLDSLLVAPLLPVLQKQFVFLMEVEGY